MTRFAGDRMNNIRRINRKPIRNVGDPFIDLGNAGREMKRENILKALYKRDNPVWPEPEYIPSNERKDFNYSDAMYEYLHDQRNDVAEIKTRNIEQGNVIPLNLKDLEMLHESPEVGGGGWSMHQIPHLNLADSSYKKWVNQAETAQRQGESLADQDVLVNMIRNEKAARLLGENDAQSFENRLLFGLVNEAPSMNRYDRENSEQRRMANIKNTRKNLDIFDVLNSGPEFNRTAPNVANLDIAQLQRMHGPYITGEDDIPF